MTSAHLKAIVAVIIMAGVLSLPLYFYSDFLNRGRSPTKSAQILNQLEKEGLRDFILPEFETEKEFQLKSFKGKVVLLNFWATWCVPCVKEIPSLVNLARKMKGKMVILAVSQDKHADDLKAFLKSFAPYPDNFHVLWDKDRKVADAYGTEALPESYVISPQLKLVRKVVGVEEWDHDRALEFFNEIYTNGTVTESE